MTELALTTMDKVLRDAGAPRVSKKAAKAFAEEIEKRAFKIAKKASELSKHAGRKTVLSEDIKFAKKKL